MGQIHELSFSRDHWLFDNAYATLDVQNDFSSEYAVESINQQVLSEEELPGITAPKFYKSKSEFDNLHKGDIQVSALMPQFKQSKIYTKNTKTWKGVITKLNKISFSCRLYDLDEKSDIYEIADFSIESIISEEDKPLLEVGAIFYWSVGSIIRNGTKKNQSEIRLRRVAAMDADEFDEFYDESKSNYIDLLWD